MKCLLSFPLLFNSFSLYRIIINYLPSQDRNERYLFYEIRRFLKRQIAFIGLLYLLFSVRLNPPEKLAIYIYICFVFIFLFLFFFLGIFIIIGKKENIERKKENIFQQFLCAVNTNNEIEMKYCVNWLKDYARWRYVFWFLFLMRYILYKYNLL